MAVRVSGNLNPANNGIFYLHSDHLGSVSAMSDANGDLVGEVTRYTPFGSYRSGGPNPITDRSFTGQKENMADLGLYYYNARYYAPGLKRFLSADTLVPDPQNPQQLNRYTYSLNSPVNYSNLTGHYACIPNRGPKSCALRNLYLYSSWNLGLIPEGVNQNQYNLMIYDVVDTMINRADFESLTTGDIPMVSRIVKRMIARESQFNTFADNGMTGSTHAVGLMQITDIGLQDLVARDWLYRDILGLPPYDIDRTDPRQNIQAGVALFLTNYSDAAGLGVEDKNERLKFALGIYNGGYWNIQQAQSLCADVSGCDPTLWDHVNPYLCEITGFNCLETQTYVGDVMEDWIANPVDGIHSEEQTYLYYGD